MKAVAYIAGLLGLALLVGLVIHADVPAMLHTWRQAGAPLLWVVPYRGLYFALYAVGWYVLLRPFDPRRRAGYGYVLGVTVVREAVDRLLPVANVGGGVVGVRLLRWRDLAVVSASATVIVEVLLTLIAVYVFGALATLILVHVGSGSHRDAILVLVCSLPIPVVTALLLRYGSIFARLERFLGPMMGISGAEAAASLDADLRACLRRVKTLVMVGALEFVALASAAFEIWWVLRLFDHPVSPGAAFMLEGLMQSLRHLAFIVPAGLGVQEGALVLFGHALGISTELALTVSAVKRLREVLCGVPPLLWWQWRESLRLSHARASRS